MEPKEIQAPAEATQPDEYQGPEDPMQPGEAEYEGPEPLRPRMPLWVWLSLDAAAIAALVCACLLITR